MAERTYKIVTECVLYNEVVVKAKNMDDAKKKALKKSGQGVIIHEYVTYAHWQRDGCRRWKKK